MKQRKANVIIRMGAGKFEAVVRHEDRLIAFDFNKLPRKAEHQFRKELCIAFREANFE